MDYLCYTQSKFNYSKIKRTLLSNETVTFYVLNNNFSYTELPFAFVLQKDSYYVQDDTDAFFLFLLQKDFDICRGPFSTFCLFLFQKDLDIFHVLLFEAFVCFLIIVICHFYI